MEPSHIPTPFLGFLFDGARVLLGFLLAVFVFFLVSFLQSRKNLYRFQIIVVAAAILFELSIWLLDASSAPGHSYALWSALPFFLASLLVPASLGLWIDYSSGGGAVVQKLKQRGSERGQGHQVLALLAYTLLISLLFIPHLLWGGLWVFLDVLPIPVIFAIVIAQLWHYRQTRRCLPMAISGIGYTVLAIGLVLGTFSFLSTDPDRSWFFTVGLSLMQLGILELVICFMVLQENQILDAQKDAELANDQLRFIQNHDGLTGLYNRSHFFERLGRESVSSARQLCPLALFYLDLDHFRDINDTLTNEAGNILLQAVAERLTLLMANTENVFRIGEDEFAVLAECPHSQVDAAAIAEDILTLFNRPYKMMGSEVYLTASIGIAFLGSGEDAESGPKKISRQVDQALSHAKLDRNTYRFYTPALADRGLSKLQYINYLRQAIDRHELSLHYQPQVNRQGQVVSAEALLRWNNPELGSVPPSEFIPIAEEAGLIIPIGEWVIDHACSELAHWHSLGLFIPMAINLSTRQLKDVRLERLLLSKLKKYGIQPHYLHLEITESSLLDDSERTTQILENLTKAGFSLSIDDFGTGYANLAWLKRLPISTVKIDRSFVVDLPDNLQDMAVVQAIFSMAKGLGLSIIAEGVDSRRQLDVLQEIENCLIQGFYFSRPLPSKEFVDYVRSVA